MSTITIADAQANLAELVHQLTPGQELVITEHNRPIAKLVPTSAARTPKLGTMAGTVVHMAPDFDAPLDDFKEYM